MTEKPVVGVTGPDHGGIAAWWMTCPTSENNALQERR